MYSGGLLSRIGHYSLAKGSMMAAGLISYPILTRVLSPAEYGVMGLVLTLLNISIGFAKLGLQFSTIRLWSRWDETEEQRGQFTLTFLVAGLLASVAVTALGDLAAFLLGPLIGRELAFFILLASPLVLIRVLSSFGLALLNARQASKPYALFEVVTAWTAMILAVLGATVVIGGLTGYYVGLSLGEGLAVLALLVYVLRGVRLGRAGLHLPLVREGVAFGFPMSIYEMSGVLFYTGDRFIILWLADKVKLGYYTVAFNLTQYIHVLFTLPVMMTVQPAVTALFEKEGPEPASRILRTAARFFFLFSMAAVAGMAIIRKDLLALLASKTFLPGADLVPVLLAGLLVSGSRDILGSGLFLKKRPWRMALFNLLGAVLNLGLNVVLMPSMGIQGAALATLISQTMITVIFWILGSRLVPVSLDLPALARHALAAVAMAAAIYFIDPGHGVLRLGLRLVAGALLFTGLLALLDREARELLGKVAARLRGDRDGR